jgi:hypothetical protein
MLRFAFIVALCPSLIFAAKPKPCVESADASKYLNKDICVSVHVYDVVKLDDGTRFLDVCPPETLDAECRFTILSLPQDSNEVGELNRYRDANVHVRGIVESMHGRAGMVLSHARQFYGGPPKFRPNARLIRGFAGDTEKPALKDPNLRSQGARRGFMNSSDRETLAVK